MRAHTHTHSYTIFFKVILRKDIHLPFLFVGEGSTGNQPQGDLDVALYVYH